MYVPITYAYGALSFDTIIYRSYSTIQNLVRT